MTIIAVGFCLLIAYLGALGLFWPLRFLELVRRLTTLQGFYLIAVLRIAFGAALYLAAPSSKAPGLMQVIGVVVFVSGLITPFFNHTRYRKVVEWWSGGGALYVRVWAGCALIFALVLAYGFVPASTD